ncbi:hypothetical protein A3862_27495 [Methylobacterium sp. XJLW]|jgi:hypothetical protein|uniref:hypothetical protein n=1 Tax=Methylobacterium sp. XJLW TaxID=739141 RepID=UPI000DAB01E0|nr:hypothetical protein [Methylobacterium sp. XJLW]AWV18827.1 hypothetical protein A3862_27495 [Methylobacterium sp. XJLW]
MPPTKKPPDPAAVAPRVTADAAAEAIKKRLPADGSGLGPVGEEVVAKLLDDSEQEEVEQRLFMRFTPGWRKTIRWFDDDRLTALQELVEDHRERKAIRKLWRRFYKVACLVVPVIFAWAQGFFDKALPLLREALKLLNVKGGGS